MYRSMADYTLEEYSFLVDEYAALSELWKKADILEQRYDITSPCGDSGYIPSLKEYRKAVLELESSDSPWRGEDADSFYETAMDISSELWQATVELQTVFLELRREYRKYCHQLDDWICEYQENAPHITALHSAAATASYLEENHGIGGLAFNWIRDNVWNKLDSYFNLEEHLL